MPRPGRQPAWSVSLNSPRDCSPSGPSDPGQDPPISRRRRTAAAGGRPVQITPEIEAQLCNVIQSGCYFETAAKFAGISKTTFYRWLRLGAKARCGKYRQFYAAIEKAKAQAEIRDLLKIQQAANEHWQAAAWRLERRYPKRWGRRNRDQLEATEKGRTPEEIAAEIREFVAAAKATVPGPPPPITPPASAAGCENAGHDPSKEPTA